jgi:hypothetical protein
MNITKEQADKVIAALETTYFREIDIPAREQALSIMRGLEDAAPVCNHEWFQTGAMLSNEKRCIKCGEWGKLYTSPQAAQTAVKSESSAQAAQAPARLPGEGKPIEALAPTEAQEHPAYPEGDVVGPCVCGSWPGGKCLRCEWLTEADKLLQQALEALDGALSDDKPYIAECKGSATAIRTYLEGKKC